MSAPAFDSYSVAAELWVSLEPGRAVDMIAEALRIAYRAGFSEAVVQFADPKVRVLRPKGAK